MSIAVDFVTDSWCGLGAALKGGTLCGAKKVLNWIVYGLLVGFVLVRSPNIEGDLELDIAYPGGKHRWGV